MAPEVADRLCDGRAIGAVLRGRSKHVGDLLVAHALPRNDGDPTRLAVMASKRVGGAVQRNRAKRLLREAARLRAWGPGYDLVLAARAACVRSSLDEVVHELEAALDALELVPTEQISRVGASGTPT